MPNITLSSRNQVGQTQGAVAPIKMTQTTQAHGPTHPIASPSTQSPNPVPVEPQTSPEAAKTTEDPLISSKFAALARKEKALRMKYTEFQQKESELKGLQEEIAKARSFREQLKSDPLTVLNQEGITYDQLVNRAVNPASQEVIMLQRELAALKGTIERQQEDSQKIQTSQREQAEKQVSMDVKGLISSDPAYETVKDMGAEDAVTQLIVRTYDEDGILLTVDSAAKQVNDYLTAELKRIYEAPSAKKLFTPPAPVEPPKQTTQKNTTLSNSMAATTSPKPTRTWAERRRDAILAAQGKLNK